jgi:SET domain-containing protein
MARGTAPLAVVGDSPIHGRGLFAARDIPADTLILRIEGRPTKRDGAHVIWTQDDRGDHGFLVTNEARFVNHADDANAAFFDMELWSLRRIRKGEEITHDYTGRAGAS